jgi:hypothetical protein
MTAPRLEFRVSRIELTPPQVATALRAGMVAAVAAGQDRMEANLSGGLVRRRSGQASRSVKASIVEHPRGLIGRIFVSDADAWYVRLLDQGVQPHELGRGARTARQPSPSRRRGQRGRGRVTGARASVLRIPLPTGVIFRYGAHHRGIRPRRIAEVSSHQAEPRMVAAVRGQLEAAVAAVNG